MPAPERNDKPPVPPVLAHFEVERSAPDYKQRLHRFSKEVEALLELYQVTEYVVARGDRDDKHIIAVIPCASTPQLRTGAAPDLETARRRTAAGIADAVERSAKRKDAEPASQPKGMAPKKKTGVGLRKR